MPSSINKIRHIFKLCLVYKNGRKIDGIWKKKVSLFRENWFSFWTIIWSGEIENRGFQHGKIHLAFKMKWIYLVCTVRLEKYVCSAYFAVALPFLLVIAANQSSKTWNRVVVVYGSRRSLQHHNAKKSEYGGSRRHYTYVALLDRYL